MGSKRQFRKGFAWFWAQTSPAVIKAGATIVSTLENEAFNVLEGGLKEKIAIEHIKDTAKRESRELTTTAAKTLVNGLLEGMRKGVLRLEELGEGDDEVGEGPPDVPV